jgi:hypothetical protein
MPYRLSGGARELPFEEPANQTQDNRRTYLAQAMLEGTRERLALLLLRLLIGLMVRDLSN